MVGAGRVKPPRTVRLHLGPGLFEPDVLLREQFEGRQRSHELQPEKRLMLAVLADAVDAYRKYAFAKDPRGRALYLETEAWIASEDRTWIYSFERICEALGIESDYLRRGLVACVQRLQAGAGSSRLQAARAVLGRLGTMYIRVPRLARAIGVEAWRVERWRAGQLDDCTPAHVAAMEAYADRVAASRREGATAPILIARLEAAGWSQVKIARRLAVSEQAVSGWATARVNPRDAHLAFLRRLVADETGPTPLEAAAC